MSTVLLLLTNRHLILNEGNRTTTAELHFDATIKSPSYVNLVVHKSIGVGRALISVRERGTKPKPTATLEWIGDSMNFDGFVRFGSTFTFTATTSTDNFDRLIRESALRETQIALQIHEIDSEGVFDNDSEKRTVTWDVEQRPTLQVTEYSFIFLPSDQPPSADA